MPLTRDQRRRLLDALDAISVLAKQDGRDLLLTDLPRPLARGIPRSDNPRVDLHNIVQAVDDLGTLDDGTPALLVLLENALNHSRNSAPGRTLQALYDELRAPPAPPPPTLPPIERAERYKALQAARAAGNWAQVLELAGGIETFRDVAALVAQAQEELDQARRLRDEAQARHPGLLEELAEAYAADEWAQIIRLARALGPDAPPEVAAWVARAWQAVPVAQQVLAGHENWVVAVAVTPDGRQVLSGSYDRTLWLWDLATGQHLRTFPDHEDPVQAVAVTPDGRRALSGSWGGTLRLWDLAAGQELRSFTGHAGAVMAVTVTPDGRQALSSAEDRMLRLWDLASGRELRSFSSYQGYVYAVAVTPDGRQALSGSKDGTLRLWDLAAGQHLRSFTGHQGTVYAVAVAPDGCTLVSGGEDGTVRVWTLPAGPLGPAP